MKLGSKSLISVSSVSFQGVRGSINVIPLNFLQPSTLFLPGKETLLNLVVAYEKTKWACIGKPPLILSALPCPKFSRNRSRKEACISSALSVTRGLLLGTLLVHRYNSCSPTSVSSITKVLYLKK